MSYQLHFFINYPSSVLTNPSDFYLLSQFILFSIIQWKTSIKIIQSIEAYPLHYFSTKNTLDDEKNIYTYTGRQILARLCAPCGVLNSFNLTRLIHESRLDG